MAGQVPPSMKEEWLEASKLIVQVMNADSNYPDLYTQLMDASEPHNYFLEPYASQWHAPQLMPHGTFHPYPTVLSKAYEHMKRNNFHGLLPSIHHSWFTVDNKLFLWDYTKTHSQRITEYDAFDQEICCVGIVTPKKDVFQDFVKHVLVVATSVEITLIGAVFEEDGTLKLYPSPLKISTDNEPVSRIVGTATGRIFFGGGNGPLQEFIYGVKQTLWQQLGISSTCYKKEYSNGIFASIVSNMLGHVMTPVSIIDIALDNDRNMLYTLDSASKVTLFDLDVNGQETKYVADVNVFSAAAAFCSSSASNGGQMAPDSKLFSKLSASDKITSLSVVGKTESSLIHVIAVSNTGIRFYFSTVNVDRYSAGRAIPGPVRPTKLKIVHIRLPPPTIDPASVSEYHATEGLQPDFKPGRGTSNVKKSYYQKGVFLMVDSIPGKHGSVIGVTQDLVCRNSGAQSMRKPVLRESLSREELHGAVHDVVEYDTTDPSSVSTLKVTEAVKPSGSSKRTFDQMNQTTETTESFILGELTTQFFMPQRHFLCLTHMGLHIFKKLRPIDYLNRILLEVRQTKNLRLLKDFFGYFGQIQTCAMLFGIACGHATNSVQQDEMIRSDAIRYALEFGGSPRVAESGRMSGRLVMKDDVYKSAHLDGLIIFVSRILRSIWNSPIVTSRNDVPQSSVFDKNSKPKTVGSCAYSKTQLQTLRETLFQLKLLLETTMPYATWVQTPVGEEVHTTLNPSRRNVMTRTLNDNAKRGNEAQQAEIRALHAEHQSFHCIYNLVCRCMQGLSFLNLAHGRSGVFDEKSLSRLSFSAFVTSDEGLKASRQIVSTMMKQVLKENGRVDTLVDALRNECSSFFTVGDVWKYQGCQLLSKAKSVLNSSERQNMVVESLSQFIRASKHWKSEEGLEILKSTCQDYTRLYFFTGVVELSLTCAKNFDKYAAGPVTSSRYPNSSRMIMSSTSEATSDLDQQVNPMRLSCYQCILDSLEQLLKAIEGHKRQDPSLEEWTSLTPEAGDKYCKDMIACALASDDEQFHHSLYSWLLDHKHPEMLVEMQSPFIEDFLSKKDDELLSNFYVRQGRFADAALTMWYKAVKEDLVLENNPKITDRLGYFSRALSYAESAASNSYRGSSDATITRDHVAEISEKLDVAQLQADIMKQLKAEIAESRDAGIFDNEIIAEQDEDLKALTYRYLDVSVLYNQYAVKYDMWKQCLAIMHSCGSNETEAILKHWKRIVFALVPISSENASVSNWIRKKVEESGASKQAAGTFDTFEWVQALDHIILQYGRQFYGSGADFIFPVSVIAKMLEELWAQYKLVSSENSQSQVHWVVDLFKKVGVSSEVLFNSYRTLYHENGNPSWQLQMLQAMCYIVSSWHERAVSQAGDARVSFAEYCPHIVRAYEEFTTDLQAMRAPSDMKSTLSRCLEDIRISKEQLLNFREKFYITPSTPY